MFTIYRKYLEDRTIGKLVFPDGTMVCTLERPWLDNQVSVSCIPEGTYIVDRDTTGRHQWYKLREVEGRTFIEVHIANKVQELEGCIGLGCYFVGQEHNLGKSKEACQRLLDFQGEESFILEIKEDLLNEYIP